MQNLPTVVKAEIMGWLARVDSLNDVLVVNDDGYNWMEAERGMQEEMRGNPLVFGTQPRQCPGDGRKH